VPPNGQRAAVGRLRNTTIRVVEGGTEGAESAFWPFSKAGRAGTRPLRPAMKLGLPSAVACWFLTNLDENTKPRVGEG